MYQVFFRMGKRSTFLLFPAQKIKLQLIKDINKLQEQVTQHLLLNKTSNLKEQYYRNYQNYSKTSAIEEDNK